MSMIDPESALHNALRSHRRALLEQEWHEASLVKPANYIAPEVPYPIPELDCECGGTLDADEACSDCSQGHDDHDLNSCFACYERAVARAESAAEGMER